MHYALTPEQQAFRQEVRDFLRQEVPPGWRWPRYAFDFYSHREEGEAFARSMARKLGDRGWLSMTWPPQYGGKGVSPFYQLVLTEELEYRGCPGFDIFGVGMIAPTLFRFASEEQKRRFLPRIARGEIFWCECLSEPGAGSDLASLTTQATEEAGNFVINGQKVWTSGAHVADWCILLARTDTMHRAPTKHRGLGFFLVDMRSSGITVRPLVNMAGDHESNEVFFDGIRVPKENLVGGKDQGWYVAMTLLSFERAIAVPFFAVAQHYLEEIITYAQQRKPLNMLHRNRLAQLRVECEIGRLLTYRAAWLQEAGIAFDAEAAEVKLFNTELNQRIAAAAMDIVGLHGNVVGSSRWSPMDGRAPWYYLRSVGNTLEMGASEVDRDIIALRKLGLPRP